MLSRTILVVMKNPIQESEGLLAKAHLGAIVESSDDAIVSKTLDGTITSWNCAAETIFGYSAVEAIGQHITLITPQNRFHEEDLIIRKIKAGERVDHFSTRFGGTSPDLQSNCLSPCLRSATTRATLYVHLRFHEMVRRFAVPNGQSRTSQQSSTRQTTRLSAKTSAALPRPGIRAQSEFSAI